MPSTTFAELESATNGFGTLFNDDLGGAKEQFDSSSSPFHLMGNGVMSFLQAALGLEPDLIFEASKSLALAEAGARQKAKQVKSAGEINNQYAVGLEWDIVATDATILLAVTQALSESYLGYARCLYSLNNAHSRFTSMYKIVFPNGIDRYSTPGSSQTDLVGTKQTPMRSSSKDSSLSTASQTSLIIPFGNMLSRWMGGSNSPVSPSKASPSAEVIPKNAIDHLIFSGVAFGYGLFNLVLSFLPTKVRNVVGAFGFASDRSLGLRVLAVAAKGEDIHSQFALALMTYYGVVLLVSGYQADEQYIVDQYRALVTKMQKRCPDGSLWLLNRAKLQRYTGDNAAAIATLRRGLGPERSNHFKQADIMLLFELAWILLAEGQYEESAETFLKLLQLNSWSPATYCYLAAGCYLNLNTPEGRRKAQEQLDKLPGFLERRKVGGKHLPIESFIRKKIDFYKKKQVGLGGRESEYINAIRLSPAEELGIVWNVHGRISKDLARQHIIDLLRLSPAPSIVSPYATTAPGSPGEPDLTLPDELAARSLLLGILHRVAGDFNESRQFLNQVAETGKELEATWLRNTSQFELAVLAMREAESKSSKESVEASLSLYRDAIAFARKSLDLAAKGTGEMDLGPRLDSRIATLRDEIETKRRNLSL